MPTRDVLEIGQVANDGRGDSLRDAAVKINNNFGKLFDRTYSESFDTTGTINSISTTVVFTGTTNYTVGLPDGVERGDYKDFMNTGSGNVSVSGTYINGTTLLLPPLSGGRIIWNGAGWALLNTAGVGIS